MIVVIGPFFFAGLWVVVVKVWRSGHDVSAAVGWFTGTGRGVRGYHAFLAPATVGGTLLWAGAVADMIGAWMKAPPTWLDWFIGVCWGVGLLFMVTGFWMWIVQWPAFLIPPHFRERSKSQPELPERDGHRRAGGDCVMEPVRTVAIGIDLDLVPSNEGGRQTPLLGGYAAKDRFTYRPNWGLPGWGDGEQTAGPVLGFSRTNVLPGDQVRAILVPLFIDHAPEWLDVRPGAVLRMYEGASVCGFGHVRWIKPATWHMPEDEQESLAGWLSQP